MKFHVKKKVWIGFLTALLILAALWYYSVHHNQEFTETSRMVAHTKEVLYHIERCRSGALLADKNLINYLTTGDSIYHREYHRQVDSIRDHRAKLIRLVQANAYYKNLLDSMTYWGRQKYECDLILFEIREQQASSLNDLIDQFLENDYLLGNYIGIIRKMSASEEGLLRERILMSERNLKKFNITFSALITSTVIILIVVFTSINKTMRAKTLAEGKLLLANNELEAFTYSVSHDLRAPLRSINGYAQILAEDYSSRLDDEGVRVVNVIMRNARRMGKLIDDLLDFSRLGKKKIHYMEINMTHMVEDLLKEFNDSEKNKSVEFHVHPLHDVKGDNDMIRQVWANLISNAIKYSSKKPLSRIEIGSTLENHSIQYFVKDNGVGFDMQYAHKLFNVFQRLHKVQEFDGTGVGLAIVNRIISRHGGQVKAEGKAGEGAAFYFTLPHKN